MLVCAHTNVAVDNLVDGLKTHGLKVIRFGSAVRVPEKLQDVTFEHALSQHPMWARLETLRAERMRCQELMTKPETTGGFDLRGRVLT